MPARKLAPRRIVLLALPVGLLIGLSLGALGGGGSILTVPALVYLLGESTHSATTTSLIIVGITAIFGAAAHMRAGRVRARAGIVFGILGAGGAFAGSRLSASINSNVLLLAFSVLMTGVAIMMLRRRGGGTSKRPRPASVHSASPTSPIRVVIAASVVGLVTGFFGVGGGFVVVPALVLALGFDMPVAVGTSLVVIAINSASSLLSRIGTHATINPGLVIVFTAASIGGTLAGTRIASKSKPERLTGAFAMLMIAVALYTAARSIPSLV